MNGMLFKNTFNAEVINAKKLLTYFKLKCLYQCPHLCILCVSAQCLVL